MHAFDYRCPASLDEALKLLANQREARLLAGSMTLIPTLKQRLASPSLLVDLAGIEALGRIEDSENAIVLGAMARHADVAASDLVRARLPALAALAEGIGDPHVRNRGTCGGSISNADPAADYPAAVLGLGATLITDRREIRGDDFFVDLFETALAPGEILTAINFPIPDVSAYAKIPNPASRYATVGVFVARFGKQVRLAVTGAAASVFRLIVTEAALEQSFEVESVREVEVVLDALNTDGHAAADYRAHLIGVAARRAVASCLYNKS
jgi:carbon-monoxide dehydrogenase medium subunit